jgi:GTP-binding protein EngB required for normal cell division
MGKGGARTIYSKEEELDVVFGAFIALGIGLYVVMLFPSGSHSIHDPKSPINLYQEHSDASIIYLVEQALNRALIESHGMVSPFYTTTIQQICGTISKLVGTLNTATLERSLSVSLRLHQRAPTQQTKQEIIKFSEAILQELDVHPFEIELRTSAKFSSLMGDLIPFFVLLLVAGFTYLVIAQISSTKMAVLFILYIPPFISILTSRGWIEENKFNPLSITFKHTQSHVGYNYAMQALMQTVPSRDSTLNETLYKSTSMFQLEAAVLKHNQTLRQQFNSSVSRKNVFMLIDLAGLIHNLRYHLINEYVIGMIGTSNTGKSTLCHKIWNLETSPSIANRTVNARLFYLPEQPLLRVMDFPGCNDLDDRVAEQWDIYKQLVKIWIVIIDGQHIEREQVQLISQVKRTNISYIILINQMDKFVREFKNDEVAWLRFRKEKCEDLLTLEESCFLTAIDPLVPLNNSVVLNASATAKVIAVSLQQLGFILESSNSNNDKNNQLFNLFL